MWRPLRPRVKRELRRLQRGEVNDIVITTRWEYDEVDRRMRRFEAKQALLRPFEEENEERRDGLAEVIALQTRFTPGSDYTDQRHLKVVGSDVTPPSDPDTRDMARRLRSMRHMSSVPNALSAPPEPAPKPEPVQPSEPESIGQMAELVAFIHQLVHNEGVVDVSTISELVCYRFEMGVFSNTELVTAIEVVMSEQQKGNL